ncbi:hypothetical protein Sjap_011417 [Stephania japonica]|uniref:Uncharacterized protein n=1 Tax=Stephania japonica TaxID=461633 RepID=A0AAP0P7D8_9MAGN
MVKGRRRISNMISGINNSDGVMVHDQKSVVKVIETYFEGVYQSRGREGENFAVLDGMSAQISDEEWFILDRPFEEDEVHTALMEMHPNKTPGPDGFTNVSKHLHESCKGTRALSGHSIFGWAV